MCRHRSFQPDQRYPGSLEDRVRHCLGRGRGYLLQQPPGHRHPAVPPRGGKSQSRFRRQMIRGSTAACTPTRSACSRSSRTPFERLQIHRTRRRALLDFSCRGGWTRITDAGPCQLRRCLRGRDSGIGIPPKSRESSSRRSSSGCEHKPQVRGTGLGLAISRELASLLARDPAPQPARRRQHFTLYLPLKYAGPSVPQRGAIAPATAPSRHCRSDQRPCRGADRRAGRGRSRQCPPGDTYC